MGNKLTWPYLATVPGTLLGPDDADVLITLVECDVVLATVVGEGAGALVAPPP
jgi:hypothetical protein